MNPARFEFGLVIKVTCVITFMKQKQMSHIYSKLILQKLKFELQASHLIKHPFPWFYCPQDKSKNVIHRTVRRHKPEHRQTLGCVWILLQPTYMTLRSFDDSIWVKSRKLDCWNRSSWIWWQPNKIQCREHHIYCRAWRLQCDVVEMLFCIFLKNLLQCHVQNVKNPSVNVLL